MTEKIIPLPNGGTLRCGKGTVHVWGGSVRLCDPKGNEIHQWDAAEWQEDGESVMGAIFASALTPMAELLKDKTLFPASRITRGEWVSNK